MNLASLDFRYDPNSDEEEEDDTLAKELKKRTKRPEPDGDFVSVQLRNDHLKTVRIVSDLLDKIQENVTLCLKQHVDIFLWYVVDMPGIPPEVASYHLREIGKDKGR